MSPRTHRGASPIKTWECMMMNGIVGGSGSMMWGMGWGGLLIVALVVLGVAALAKYLFFNNKR
jgi:hypothetical protein